jgi:hypothetical protein
MRKLELIAEIVIGFTLICGSPFIIGYLSLIGG